MQAVPAPLVLDVRDELARAFRPVSRDVTAAKHVEEALRVSEEGLRDLNATLESKVAERTAERDRVWQISRDLIAVVGADGILDLQRNNLLS